MFVRTRFPFHIILIVVFVLTGFGVQDVTAKAKDNQITVASYELIGTVNIPTGTQFEDTEVGGLSSISYDPARNFYYAISDDQGTIDPVRYYTLRINLSDGQLDPGDITFLEVTTILNPSGVPYAPGSLDPEGFTLAHGGSFYFSSEGFANRTPPVDPFINRINRNGRQTRSLEIPEKFLPNATGTQGVRLNLGFESLNVTQDQKTLVTASEGALAQDGPAANVGQSSLARILQYRLSSGGPGSETCTWLIQSPKCPFPQINSVSMEWWSCCLSIMSEPCLLWSAPSPWARKAEEIRSGSMRSRPRKQQMYLVHSLCSARPLPQ